MSRNINSLGDCKIYEHIIEKLNSEGAIHLSLIDPDPLRQSPDEAVLMAKYAKNAGTDSVIIGGSTVTDPVFVDRTVEMIKQEVDLPVIIFPGGIANVSKRADAIFFMSILNSNDPFFIVGQQALASYSINMSPLESIATAYLLMEPGATAGWVANAKLLPRHKPELAVAYALVAEMYGFKLLFIDTGSGGELIPTEIIKLIAGIIHIPIIVGGGVVNESDARTLIEAGVDMISMGTFLEKNILNDQGESLKPIIDEMKKAGKNKQKKFQVRI